MAQIYTQITSVNHLNSNSSLNHVLNGGVLDVVWYIVSDTVDITDITIIIKIFQITKT